jgi:mxaC protein
MSEGFDFAQPWMLLLLPLALLPLLQSRRDSLLFSHVAWLPADRAGQILASVWRASALLAIACIVLALAGPGRSQTQVMRTGQGAEILVLIDRSRSMDERMLTSDWQKLDPLRVRFQAQSRGQPKGKAARDLLSKFVAERPDDRFALMFFSANPIHVVPFTRHDAVIQAAITAGGVGRGLTSTDVGWALNSAIEEFDQRAYSGSRIILLVSDGGAKLDADVRKVLREGLLRNRITLNWIYLRSVNGADFNAVEGQSDTLPEIALHRFFQSLDTPYKAYQAMSPQDLAEAVTDIGKQQNFPIDFLEHIPRRDFTRYFLAAAAFFCIVLLAYRSLQMRSWT